MGIFSFITDFFSSGKGKAKPRQKSAKATAGKVSEGKTASIKKKKKEKSAPGLGLTLSGVKTKKRKKSQKISSAPIDSALGFSISLKDEDEHAKKRDALRIRVDGLTVLVKRLKKQFPVNNISATGLGFDFEKPHIKGGVKLEMDIILNGKTKISGVMTKVMRHERGSVGCVFQDLDRAQDDEVHAIVLLGQKQQADRKKAHRDTGFKVPE